jgi:hypothetical protein
MSECAVCFDAIPEEDAVAKQRFFMPCCCRILVCDTCVAGVARIGRCLWCRKMPGADAYQLLYLSSNTIETLRERLRDTAWRNTLLRVEMYHFRRFENFKLFGFVFGVVGGLGVGLTCSLFTTMLAACGAISMFHFMNV